MSELEEARKEATLIKLRKAIMEARLNTSAQGNKISLADLSAGCQAASAEANLA